MKFRLLPHWKISPQKGGALFVLLAIVGIAAALLVGTLPRKAAQIEHDQQTASALAQAKDALIGYATTYRDRNGSKVFGFLPCPDMGRNPAGQEGMEDSVGCIDAGNKDKSVIGRLPWRTLGLPPLRDGNGECLWYAVSGNFKNNTQTDLMSWDTNGQFEVLAQDGVNKIAGTSATNRAVAIIFSPGSALAGQNRAPNANITAPECGGNMDAANYLDSAAIGGTAFTNYLANASSSFITAQHVIDAAANQIKQFITGEAKDANGNTLINDRLLFVTPDEIFAKKVEKRPDFPAYLAPPIWVKNTAYKSGYYVSPTSYNGHCYQATSSGTSGSTEPLWPTNGTAVPDNSTSWKDIGVSCQALAKTAECIARYGLSVNSTTKRLPWAAPLNMDAMSATKYGTNSSYDATTGTLRAGRTPYKADNTNTQWLNSANILCPNFDVNAYAWWQNYKDQLFYAVADAYKPGSGMANCGTPSTCLTVDGNGPYAAVVIFSGKKLAAENAPTGQSRNTNADYTSTDKSSLLNYLAATNRTAMAAPGNGNFTKGSFTSASNNDMLACLKCDLSLDVGCSATSLPTCASQPQISFQNNLGEFVSTGSAIGGVSTNPIDQTVTLASGSNAAGCLWYPTALSLNGKTLHAYYEFNFAKKDNQAAVQFFPAAQASSQYGYGFTFAILRGDVAITNQCGAASRTGIAGGTMGSLAITNLFLETDVWSPSTPNNSIEQPYKTSGSKRAFYGNHVSAQRNSSLTHAANAVTSTCNQATPSTTVTGCFKSGDPTWLEDPTSAATATIKVGNSGSNASVSISDVKVNGVSIINTAITAPTGTNSATERQTVANNLAAAINNFVSVPDYTACAGTTCAPALATDTVKITATATGTGPNGYLVQVMSPPRTTARVAFSRAGVGNTVSSIRVNGVEILNATITAAGGNNTARIRDLAKKACNQINAYANITPFEYTAASTATGTSCPTNSNIFYIQAPAGVGGPFPVAITPTSGGPLTYTISNGSTLQGSIPVTNATGITPTTPIMMSGGSTSSLSSIPNQRVEIQTRCNNSCSTCNSPLAASTYMWVKAWEQCSGCSDTTTNYTAATPTINACINMAATGIPRMDTVKFGFTAGSLAAPNNQSVTIQNFALTIN